MVHGMLNGGGGGKNFAILDQFGTPSSKKTKLHDEASDQVFGHINKILKAKGAVAGKK